MRITVPICLSLILLGGCLLEADDDPLPPVPEGSPSADPLPGAPVTLPAPACSTERFCGAERLCDLPSDESGYMAACDQPCDIALADELCSNPPQLGCHLVARGAVSTYPDATGPTALWHFGAVAAGESLDVEVALVNDGSASCPVIGLELSAAQNAFVVVDSPALPLELGPGESAALAVRFAPKTTGALEWGSLFVTTDVPTSYVEGVLSPQPVTVSGITLLGLGVGANNSGCTVAVQDSFVPTTGVAFGGTRIGRSRLYDFRVINLGGSPCTLAPAAVEGSAAFSAAFAPYVVPGRTPFATTLAPTEAALLEVEFTPPAAGSYAASVVVGVQGAAAQHVTVGGEGVDPERCDDEPWLCSW